jgi:hypothetical protein
MISQLGTVEEEYEKHQGILHWQVQKLKQRCPNFDYSDAFQIASVGFLRAYRTYDENKKCKFSTYLTLVVMNDMASILDSESRKWKKKIEPLEEELNIEYKENPDVEGFLVGFLPQLSAKAQRYVKDILEDGRKYKPGTTIAKEVLSALKKRT